MSATSSLLTEDQFLCSICLDVFTDPVTIPCGHNFCKICITDHWTSNVTCRCPDCNKLFNSMPELLINYLFSEVAAQFRQSVQEKANSSSSRSEPQVSKPGDVPCDVCTGSKKKALKSCLRCLVSYCETHLEPHLTAPRLKRHQLIEPVENLEDRMCMNHDGILELFCRTDQKLVCLLCTVLDHKTHDVVPLREEYKGKKAELEKTDAEIQQMIQKRQLKIQEFKRSVELSKEDADREMAVGVQVFTALKESVERRQAEVINTMKEKQKQTEKQAEDDIQELEEEICELKKRSSEVEQLSHSEDHLHLIQSFLYIRTAPPTKDWSGVSARTPSYLGTVRAAVSQLEESLREQMKKIYEAENMRNIQQYAVDVTFDRNTATAGLTVSDDGKRVACLRPKSMFVCLSGLYTNILAKQSFSSGIFYYEVQVERKIYWGLGVVIESINRKAWLGLTPQKGCWMIRLLNAKEYKVTAECLDVRLPLKSRPKKVGVFVDYDKGLISFYDVDAAFLIYSFTGCDFTERIYPYFCTGNYGRDFAPLIITPVNHTE